MKKVFLLVFVLLLSFPTITLATELPKEFLGRWEPISSGAGGAVMQINSNGFIYDISMKTGKILRIHPYRIIFTRQGKTYIFLHSLTDHAYTNIDVWHITNGDQTQKLHIDSAFCDFTTDDFVRFSRSKLQSIIEKNTCPNGDSPTIGGMIFGRDEKR